MKKRTLQNRTREKASSNDLKADSTKGGRKLLARRGSEHLADSRKGWQQDKEREG